MRYKMQPYLIILLIVLMLTACINIETENKHWETYDDLISEWESAYDRHVNGIKEHEIFSFGFYGGDTGVDKAYYALYDIDSNGISELLLRKQNGHEDIIAYIFVIKDGEPINLFGYNERGVLNEVPWSRVGACSILDNGLIDCYNGDYTIYKIAENGYSLVEFASASPYDYPSEALLAEAKWRYYINEEEVDSEFYYQFLKEHEFVVYGDNTLANIVWESVQIGQ